MPTLLDTFSFGLFTVFCVVFGILLIVFLVCEARSGFKFLSGMPSKRKGGLGWAQYGMGVQPVIDFVKEEAARSAPKFVRGDVVEVIGRGHRHKRLQGIVLDASPGFEHNWYSLATLSGGRDPLTFTESYLVKIGQVGEEEIKALGGD